MMKSRAVMRRRQGKPEGNADVAAGKTQIPNNSEPWLPRGVCTVADALWISDQIQKDMERWKITRPPTN